MSIEMNLGDFLTAARYFLPTPDQSRAPEDASGRALQAVVNGLAMREGATTEAAVRAELRVLQGQAQKALSAAVGVQTGFTQDDVRHWEYDHSPRQLHELWDLALELTGRHTESAEEPTALPAPRAEQQPDQGGLTAVS